MAMEEKRKSRLYRLKFLTDRLPAVTRPEGHGHFRTKLFWVLFILILYFVMTNVFLYGLDRSKTLDFFASLRAILAGAQGSLMHLGIGPIVTGSIIMQLFAGAKIINLDLKDDEDKSVYQGTQKLLVIIMIFVAAIPKTIYYLQNLNSGQIASGGLEQVMLAPPNALIALVGTIAIFFIVSYVESTRIELPLAHGTARGARGRYPIRLLYASNIPVILIAAVLANVSMFSLLFWQHPEWPVIGHAWWIGMYPSASDARVVDGQLQQTTPIGGIAF